MLKYNIKVDGKGINEEIKFGEFYLSPDLSFISGVTDYNLGLIDNEKVKLSVPFYDGLYETPIRVNNVKRQGYVIYNKPYKISSLIVEDNTTYYILYSDGKYYYESVGENPYFYINNKKYYRDDDYVYIDTKYWVENGLLNIDNISYEIDLNLTKNSDGSYNAPIIQIEDGTLLTLVDFEYDKWHYVTKFIISKGDDFTLDVESVTCAEYYKYISYGNVQYEVSSDNKVNIDNIEYTIYSGDTDSNNMIDVNGSLCDIKYGWRSTSKGQYLYIFLNNTRNFYENQIINVISSKNVELRVPVIENNSDKYIVYNGQKYNVEKNIKDTIVVNNKEYDVVYYNDNGIKKAYVFISGIRNELKVQDNRLVRDELIEIDGKVDYSAVTYTTIDDADYINGHELKHYDGVNIDGNIYTMSENTLTYYSSDTSINEYVVREIIINKEMVYELIITEIDGTNMLRCSVNTNYDELTEDEIKTEAESICTTIYNNLEDFYFSLPNKMFGDEKIKPEDGMGNFVLDSNAKSSDVNIILLDVLKIYKINDYINLPLTIEYDVANNLFQEMVLEDKFYNVEKENSINRIVDMEREIYIPAYRKNKSTIQDFSLINEIIFNLHFRTRDLETWKLIEDDGTPATSATCNWFITDYVGYNNVDDNVKMGMSDLLYFLDFDNDDVFYQKTKLSKSFLRLSFYDSPDPKVQSLLHTSTIFMDEGILYKKYINNVKNGNFISVNNETLNTITNSIGVDVEPVDSSNNIIFDEDKRLSCRFSVKNKYEDVTSSEGFYIYMFKEYSTNLHERSIYMKVEFNHAGIGRTIPFMMPLNENGDIETDINNFKQGYPLSEIYKQMFIELKVVYDAVNRHYVYYLPFPQESTELTFNLFEIKIQDES
jgi:hypothetical protein